jgi:hypothetical protein
MLVCFSSKNAVEYLEPSYSDLYVREVDLGIKPLQLGERNLLQDL